MQPSLNAFQRYLIQLPRVAKRGVMMAADVTVMPLALYGAFALRLGEPLPSNLVQHAWLLMAIPLLSVPALQLAGMYRSVVRFMGPTAVLAVLRGGAASVAVFLLLVVMFRLEGVPRSSYAIYWLLLVAGLSGSRFAARMWLPKPGSRLQQSVPVLVYGAGMAGIQLADMLENGHQYRVVGFIDDDPAKQGTEIRDIRVHSPREAEQLIRRHGISEILLAMPATPRGRRREIVESMELLPVHVRTVPGLADIISGAASMDELREIDSDDLLGRQQVPPDPELLDRCIRDRSVMVTGAGGSIGSELGRQIVQRGPRKVVLFEQSEFSLYRVERELEVLASSFELSPEIVPVLGNVLEYEQVRDVMREHGVETVYHAAAYKHVPLVESNPVQGVRNNIFGTLNTVRAALDSGVANFVLISTDKAVNPTNVMGASKRVAEMIVQGLAATGQSRPTLSIVRFGNVLDSSGSVVPVFRDQIRRGGPVTVTHPEVNRYFMTIPEASQLVLQAGSLGEDGDVFVLDMGEPVQIVELARRMIHLSGLTVRGQDNPYGDIEIHFTGLRPGEKLYEELLLGEDVSPTVHPMIKWARETYLEWELLDKRLDMLSGTCARGDVASVRQQLAALVDGYEGGPFGALPEPSHQEVS